MKHSLICLILCVLATTLLLHPSQHLFISAKIVKDGDKIDRQALLDVKGKVTNDPLGVLTSWNDTTTLHHCKWHGVTCGRRHQRVTMLNLTSSKLTGTLSPYLGNLSFLRGLYLDQNSFSGTIPTALGHLNRLQTLFLSNNSIGGEIPPNISSCSKLVTLDVRGNMLGGEIPSWLGSLSNLQNLDLMNNQFTGRITSSLGNLSSLIFLQLRYNNLVGNIPSSLSGLINLKFLSLAVNMLSGEVPSSIFNLSTLEQLDLGGNLLHGRLPSKFHAKLISNLRSLSLSTNRFTGSIPPIMSNFSNLGTLQLGNNSLQGQLPPLNNLHNLVQLNIGDNFLGNGHPADLNFISTLANSTMLEHLTIMMNNFGGAIPHSICNFSMLTDIRMGKNKLVGHIPTCLENLEHLEMISFEHNHLVGAIPPNIGKLTDLKQIYLDRNHLSSDIPFSVGNLTKLIQLSLYTNNLQGHIPSTLGNCTQLEVLDIDENYLTGTIPPQVLSLSSLILIDISINLLVGPLPHEVGQMKNLNYFIVSYNNFSGEIPSTLGACIELVWLEMSDNMFQGTIPQTLVALKGLSLLNMSYNNLEGEVPIGGIFDNINSSSFFGNSRLCGGKPELKLPLCNYQKVQKRRLHHQMRVLVIVLSGFSIILLVAFAYLYVIWYRNRTKPTTKFENSWLNVSYQSLIKATNGFSPESLIGSGTFGVVYKGILDHFERVVAIKRFNLEHSSALKSFMVECEALKNIRHRNLVKVITACSSVDFQGNDFKALVYEYMSNGSLDSWLHLTSISCLEGTSDAPRNLNVQQRLGIILDVAYALEYLHHRCESPIVHCDLKPSNVLLDDEMVAHVSDFGLAKFLLKDISNSHESSSIGIRGTIGYAPPEYGVGNEVSTQGDVYSFGILSLELFTGKRPTNEMFKDGLNLHKFVKAGLPERMTNVIDETLHEELVGDHERERSSAHNRRITNGTIIKTSESIISVLEVALSCSAELPRERPDMCSVAAKISSIRNKFLETRPRPPRRNFPGS